MEAESPTLTYETTDSTAKSGHARQIPLHSDGLNENRVQHSLLKYFNTKFTDVELIVKPVAFRASRLHAHLVANPFDARLVQPGC